MFEDRILSERRRYASDQLVFVMFHFFAHFFLFVSSLLRLWQIACSKEKWDLPFLKFRARLLSWNHL